MRARELGTPSLAVVAAKMRGARAEHRPRGASPRQAPRRPAEALEAALENGALARLVEVTRPRPQRKCPRAPIQHGIDRPLGGAPDARAALVLRDLSNRGSIRPG